MKVKKKSGIKKMTLASMVALTVAGGIFPAVIENTPEAPAAYAESTTEYADETSDFDSVKAMLSLDSFMARRITGGKIGEIGGSDIIVEGSDGWKKLSDSERESIENAVLEVKITLVDSTSYTEYYREVIGVLRKYFKLLYGHETKYDKSAHASGVAEHYDGLIADFEKKVNDYASSYECETLLAVYENQIYEKTESIYKEILKEEDNLSAADDFAVFYSGINSSGYTSAQKKELEKKYKAGIKKIAEAGCSWSEGYSDKDASAAYSAEKLIVERYCAECDVLNLYADGSGCADPSGIEILRVKQEYFLGRIALADSSEAVEAEEEEAKKFYSAVTGFYSSKTEYDKRVEDKYAEKLNDPSVSSDVKEKMRSALNEYFVSSDISLSSDDTLEGIHEKFVKVRSAKDKALNWYDDNIDFSGKISEYIAILDEIMDEINESYREKEITSDERDSLAEEYADARIKVSDAVSLGLNSARINVLAEKLGSKLAIYKKFNVYMGLAETLTEEQKLECAEFKKEALSDMAEIPAEGENKATEILEEFEEKLNKYTEKIRESKIKEIDDCHNKIKDRLVGEQKVNVSAYFDAMKKQLSKDNSAGIDEIDSVYGNINGKIQALAVLHECYEDIYEADGFNESEYVKLGSYRYDDIVAVFLTENGETLAALSEKIVGRIKIYGALQEKYSELNKIGELFTADEYKIINEERLFRLEEIRLAEDETESVYASAVRRIEFLFSLNDSFGTLNSGSDAFTEEEMSAVESIRISVVEDICRAESSSELDAAISRAVALASLCEKYATINEEENFSSDEKKELYDFRSEILSSLGQAENSAKIETLLSLSRMIADNVIQTVKGYVSMTENTSFTSVEKNTLTVYRLEDVKSLCSTGDEDELKEVYTLISEKLDGLNALQTAYNQLTSRKDLSSVLSDSIGEIKYADKTNLRAATTSEEVSAVRELSVYRAKNLISLHETYIERLNDDAISASDMSKISKNYESGIQKVGKATTIDEIASAVKDALKGMSDISAFGLALFAVLPSVIAIFIACVILIFYR